MFRKSFILFCLIFCLNAYAEQRPPIVKLSAKEAKKIAVDTYNLALRSEKYLSDALETRDESGYYRYVAVPLQQAQATWPRSDALKNYLVCIMAADSLRNYADMIFDLEGKNNPDSIDKKTAREQYKSEYKDGLKRCKKSLK